MGHKFGWKQAEDIVQANTIFSLHLLVEKNTDIAMVFKNSFLHYRRNWLEAAVSDPEVIFKGPSVHSPHTQMTEVIRDTGWGEQDSTETASHPPTNSKNSFNEHNKIGDLFKNPYNPKHTPPETSKYADQRPA